MPICNESYWKLVLAASWVMPAKPGKILYRFALNFASFLVGSPLDSHGIEAVPQHLAGCNTDWLDLPR